MTLDRKDYKTAIPQLEKRISAVEKETTQGLKGFDILKSALEAEKLARQKAVLKVDEGIDLVTVKMFYALVDPDTYVGGLPPSTTVWSQTMPNITSADDGLVLWYKSKTYRNNVEVNETPPQTIQILNGVYSFVNTVAGDNGWTTIDGSTITTGIIQASQGDSFFNLNNGTFQVWSDVTGQGLQWDGSDLLINGSITLTGHSDTLATEVSALQQSADGTLIYDHEYSISGSDITFTAHVYRGGEDVTSEFDDSAFTWYYKTETNQTEQPIDQNTSLNPPNSGKTITFALTEYDLTYGGEIVGKFEVSQNRALLRANYDTFTDVNNRTLTVRGTGTEVRVRDLDYITNPATTDAVMVVTGTAEKLTTIENLLNTMKSSTSPLMDGTASAGSEKKYASGDHRHPTDTSRAPLASPALTGTPTAPTASSGTNTTQIATTAFVKDAVDNADVGVTDVEVDGVSVVTSGVAEVDLTGKQDTLVSGTNIKTVNNTSLLGSGNISISGGGDVTDVQSDGSSVVSGTVATIPKAKYNTFGTVKAHWNGDPPAGYLTVVTDNSSNATVCVPSIEKNGAPDLTSSGTIRAKWMPDFVGTDGNSAGTKGAVPAPATTDAGKYLKADGTWDSITIPTVNNATLTIQKNGTTVNTFTANASSNVTANITVPTQASDIGAQPTLVSGTNIKTINNTSILGSGNIDVSGGGGGGMVDDVEVDGVSVVNNRVAEIDLTGKADASHTHTTSDVTDFPSLATVATSGSYSDLSNKPSIPTITDTYSGTSSNGMSGKAVKSAIDALDGTISGSAGSGKTLTAFSQTDGKVSATFGNISITKSQVSDFPALATVATSGSYSDLSNKPTIPTITDTYSDTSSDGMSGKAVKSAIDALDGTITGSAGTGKTLSAFSQTDGKVSATFSNISITKSQVSDFPTIPSTASDVGAVPTSRKVNNKALSSDITLSASDVSAIPTTAFATTDSATHCNFSTYGTAKAYVPDMRYIAFWNGAYDSSGNSNLTRCASGAILGTNTVVDYITSKGTNTGWYYEKWASGKITALYSGSVSYGSMSASGQLYRSTNNAVTIPSGIFASTPNRTEITINNASTVVVCATAVASSTTNVNVQVWRSTNASSSIDCTIRCTYIP